MIIIIILLLLLLEEEEDSGEDGAGMTAVGKTEVSSALVGCAEHRMPLTVSGTELR